MFQERYSLEGKYKYQHHMLVLVDMETLYYKFVISLSNMEMILTFYTLYNWYTYIYRSSLVNKVCRQHWQELCKIEKNWHYLNKVELQENITTLHC